MEKAPDAFRTISEVADLLDTPAHVLRFWESRFPQIRPVKRAGGRRYYRPTDVALLSGIRHLLHDQGMTIRGVQKILREQGVRHVCAFAALTGLESGALVEASAEVRDTAPPATEFAPIEAMRDAVAADGAPEASDSVPDTADRQVIPWPGTATAEPTVPERAPQDSAHRSLAAEASDAFTAPASVEVPPEAAPNQPVQPARLAAPLQGDLFADLPQAAEPPPAATIAAASVPDSLSESVAPPEPDVAAVPQPDPPVEAGQQRDIRSVTARLRRLPPGALDAEAMIALASRVATLRDRITAPPRTSVS